MQTLRRQFPWMRAAEGVLLRQELLRRAAEGYAAAGQLREAAECWAALGAHGRAGALYAQGGDLAAAAEALLAGERYAEALGLYRAWAEQLRAGDGLNQVRALLGQAVCHLLGSRQAGAGGELVAAAGQAAYGQARALLAAAEEEREAGRQARLWAELGQYGARLGRYDLVQEGYERALARLAGTLASAEALAVVRAYRAVAQAHDDRLLVQRLEGQLAAWSTENELTGWRRQRAAIEGQVFREGVRDVLHFTSDRQWAAWAELAAMEEAPTVDAYLGSLAPEGMVYIPPGAFLMGSADDDPDADDNEKPQHELWLRGYYIDRYPVTNAQYRLFIEAGGYQRREFWTKVGWQEKEQQNWQEPEHWQDAQFNRDRQPVVGVSWYEAVAYASWAGKVLPSEAEWEKAASWDPVAKRKRKYSWGDEWSDDACCITGSRLTADVGMYQKDTSAYGVMDVCGNVWEFCSSKIKSVYTYPFTAYDGREDLEGTEVRSCRGLANNAGGLHSWRKCVYRGSHSKTREKFTGFRCVVPHTFSIPDID